jgi:hypothetical protein
MQDFLIGTFTPVNSPGGGGWPSIVVDVWGLQWWMPFPVGLPGIAGPETKPKWEDVFKDCFEVHRKNADEARERYYEEGERKVQAAFATGFWSGWKLGKGQGPLSGVAAGMAAASASAAATAVAVWNGRRTYDRDIYGPALDRATEQCRKQADIITGRSRGAEHFSH